MSKIYVGNIDHHTRGRELEKEFERFGRINSFELFRDYAFVEFDHSADAKDAIYDMDGVKFDGVRLIVEEARGSRLRFGPRSYEPGFRGSRFGTKCFNCGNEGHFASDCKDNDWSGMSRRDEMLMRCDET
eukprot:777421_1